MAKNNLVFLYFLVADAVSKVLHIVRFKSEDDFLLFFSWREPHSLFVNRIMVPANLSVWGVWKL